MGRPAAYLLELWAATRAAIRRRFILPPDTDKRSKELAEKVRLWLSEHGSFPPDVSPQAHIALHVMDELSAGARADGAVLMLVHYGSPLPLLHVSRKTDLVDEGTWEAWADNNIVTAEDADEFLRYCSEDPRLELTPAFARALAVYVQAS